VSHHLPVLLVVVPLVAAPVVALLNRPRISWAVAVAVTLWVLYAALALLSQTMVDGEIHYALGGWVAPYGIEYVVDPVNAWVIVIVALIGALVTPYARMSVEREISEDRIPLFYAAFILCLTGHDVHESDTDDDERRAYAAHDQILERRRKCPAVLTKCDQGIR